MIIKAYMIILVVTVILTVIGSAVFWLHKRTRVRHNCETCAFCSLIEPGADGKLIYSCGNQCRSAEKMHYYDYALPVYCGNWQRRRGVWFPEEVGDE